MRKMIFVLLICGLSQIVTAQVRGFDTFANEEETELSETKERYKNLNLHWYEWLSMVVGVSLFAFARKFECTHNKLYKTLTVVSVVIGLPLIYLVGTLLTTALYYLIILLFIYGLLSIFFKK